ncbi:hypothetical protein F4780DRAFT_749476 [Xylariomycetidae sp. FL0641]|nr:hypothetical protein F4780DRAFT_749476 [Xylariomycetidae sp. FL0641]
MSTLNQYRYIRRLLVCIAVIFGIWYFLGDDVSRAASLSDSPSTLDFLDRANREINLELSPTIQYSRTCIKTVFSDHAPRKEVTNISQPLAGEMTTIQLDQPASTRKTPSDCHPISLTVPKPYPAKLKFPNLIFGIATAYSRLLDPNTFTSIAHWSSGTGSKLVALITDYHENAADVAKLEKEYRDHGIEAVFVKPFDPTHSTAQSHFMVLTSMVEQSGPNTEWFGLLDDDTFFPHLGPLAKALGNLDHTEDMYVGALTEDFSAVQNYGLQAFGGAGAYLSAPLAKKLGAVDQAQQCFEEFPTDQGDLLLRDCVYNHSKARLTILPGLYQHDMLHDLRGFFESGLLPLNIHHWKSWYHEPVVDMARAVHFCGDCFLQRWRFDDDTVLSNGYSISAYRPGVLDRLDLDKMELTFHQIDAGTDPRWEFTFGQVRDKVGDDDRRTFYLKASEIVGGVMRQLYVYKPSQGKGEPDEVVELVWK